MTRDRECTGCISASSYVYMTGGAKEAVESAMCERHEAEAVRAERDALAAQLAEAVDAMEAAAAQRDKARATLADAKVLIEQKDVIIGVKRLETTQADAQLAEARAALAEVTRERDALKAGTHAGPWTHEPERPWGAATWEGWTRTGPFSASVTVVRRPDPVEPVSVWGMAPGMSRAFDSADEAKAACDAALISAGWYLAGGRAT